ncbi:competence protein ComEA [Thermoactinomyces sp. DSM 45891]|uniref:ComEA family DNA-binding protein n=1 Tax=Thermoactinomyces sp. DSM 45891 TaxID=1761907 RepID=UPI00091480B8|nr:ComEA family DNA-binding protein [Thermoactinomyces sp. DSM 45891]SFX53891.1 competence protein ComEA [Thermoactinomyces sp. DSM 45891]
MLSRWTDREKKLVVALSVAVLCLLAVLLFRGEGWLSAEGLPVKNVEKSQDWLDQNEKMALVPPKRESVQLFVVDVKGAVKKPGIYQFKKATRLYEVIETAGGSTDDADLKKVNLAQEIADGSVLYIPRKGEESQPLVGQSDFSDKNGKIAINSANSTELEELPGVGAAKAEAIIQYRDKNGPFKRVADIAKVPGIGEKLLARFKDKITVP